MLEILLVAQAAFSIVSISEPGQTDDNAALVYTELHAKAKRDWYDDTVEFTRAGVILDDELEYQAAVGQCWKARTVQAECTGVTEGACTEVALVASDFTDHVCEGGSCHP